MPQSADFLRPNSEALPRTPILPPTYRETHLTPDKKLAVAGAGLIGGAALFVLSNYLPQIVDAMAK